MTNRRNENDGMGLSALWVLVFAACLALLLGMMVGDARAEGPQYPIGTELTCTWAAPADREDGSPIDGGLTYDVYHGTDQDNMTLVASGVTGTEAGGLVALRGQNWCGVVAIETTELSEGPSRMEYGPFEGVLVPTSRPNAPGAVNVIRTP